MFPRIGIWGKLLALLLTLTTVPILLIGRHLLNINREEITSTTLELQTKLAESLAGRIEQSFSEAQKQVEFLTTALTRKDLTFEQKKGMLEAYVQVHPILQEVAVLGPGGSALIHVYQKDLKELTLKHPPSSSGEESRFELRLTKEPQAPAEFVFYHPLRQQLTLYLRENALGLAEIVRQAGFAGTGFAYFVDAGGQVIVPSARNPMRSDQRANPLVATAVRNPRSLGSLHFTGPEDGHSYVGSWSPVFIGRQYFWVMVQQLADEAYAAQRKLKTKGLLALVLSASAVCLVAFYMAHWVSGPILDLTAAARQIAKGHFDIRLAYAGRRDEWGDLERSVEDMAARLKKYSEIHLDQLLAEKSKIEATIASIADGIVLLEEGRITLVNEPACRFLAPGRDRSALMGQSFNDAVDSLLRPNLLDNLAKLRAGTPAVIWELAPAPSLRYSVEMSVRKVKAVGGEDKAGLGELLILRDVTLERQVTMMKDTFVQTVAHDLRAPLSSVKGFLDILEDSSLGRLSQPHLRAVELIRDGEKRLEILVNNVLDSFRVEQGGLIIRRSPTDMASLAQALLRFFEAKAQARSNKFAFELDPPEQDSGRWLISCDNGLIERVLSNLISNAIKFTQGGVISLHLEESPHHIQASVTDTGEGMPEDGLGRLFKKYGQIPGRSDKSGAGLGLWISKEIVEAHGGKIWVKSRLGEGTTFIFTLPKEG